LGLDLTIGHRATDIKHAMWSSLHSSYKKNAKRCCQMKRA